MRGAEWVVDAFAALGETGNATGLTQRPHAGTAAGEDFVRVGLVPDVPDQSVARRIEYAMQGNGELHHAQSGA